MAGFRRLLLLMAVPVLAACVMPLPETFGQRDTLFQAETLNALNRGDFEGDVSVAELKRQGDFGLGTFNALDGEMIMLGGEVFQARDDGTATVAEDAALTPFAAVTYFEADQTLEIEEAADCAALQAQIDSELATLDAPYAIRMDGEWNYLKVRAPHKQNTPYPTLTDALADQAIFELQQIRGTLVGFRLPEYMAGVNATGYHFHFISEDMHYGGHVLECQAAAARVEIDTIDRIYIDVTP